MISSNRLFHHFLYVTVGLSSLVFAVFLSSKFVRSSFSQTAPHVTNSKVPHAPVDQKVSVESKPPIGPNLPVTGVDQNQVNSENPSATANNDIANITDSGSFLEPYVFDTRDGRRNPFRPPSTYEFGSGNEVVLPGTPLERFELDELKLAGILWGVKSPRAMIIDPLGEVHIIGKDDRIGRKRGYIASIREGEVVVIEMSSFNGQNTYATRILRIEN